MLSVSIIALSALVYVYRTLPDVQSLLSMSYQEPMRIITSDGKLIAEYGEFRRKPITYDAIPPALIHAIIATEDQRFFQHNGIDPLGILRAGFAVLREGDKVQGASTVTMQVARNFFLEKDKTFLRKIKEILLSFEIELYLSKKEIMELYCNQIFFGRRSYGVEAAAWEYYGKPLKKLTTPELAMLAGIPQAPSKNNPIRNPKKVLIRRNHVLERMLQQKYLSPQDYQNYIKAPNTAKKHKKEVTINAMHAADLIRQYWVKKLGQEAYTRGLVITTTLSSTYQEAAQRAVIQGMEQKRGIPLEAPQDILMQPKALRAWLGSKKLSSRYEWGVITSINDTTVQVVTMTQELYVNHKNIKGMDKVFIGAVVPLQNNIINQWPLAEAALVSMQASTGDIIALVGGVDWRRSHFNRVTQAMRQPGSTFKPLLVAAALRQGHHLSDIVYDEPFVAKIPGKNEYWRPENHDKEFKGAMSLHQGLIMSRNLVMVHLLSHMNIDKTLDFINDMGLPRSNLPRSLSMALGAGVANPLQMMIAYGTFINHGMRVYPHLMVSATDQNGNVMDIPFEEITPGLYTRWPEPKELMDQGFQPQVLEDDEAWAMWNVLQDVVKKGTARKALEIERSDIAGKTGTTNNYNDAWFIGMGGGYVSVVWCGYDQLKSLNTYASALALPIWIDYMKNMLKGKPLFVLPKPQASHSPELKEDVTEYWMDGSENDDWVNPDHEDVMREIL